MIAICRSRSSFRKVNGVHCMHGATAAFSALKAQSFAVASVTDDPILSSIDRFDEIESSDLRSGLGPKLHARFYLAVFGHGFA
jgi:hypothetical protein